MKMLQYVYMYLLMNTYVIQLSLLEDVSNTDSLTKKLRMRYGKMVVCYNSATEVHEVVYDGEDKPCFFNLTDDFKAGDLEILQD